jgi:alkane 1-monooxygenase
MMAWAPLRSTTTEVTDSDHLRLWWLFGLVAPYLGMGGFALHMVTGWAALLFVVPFHVFVMVPILDVIVGLDRTNRSGEAMARFQKSEYYTIILRFFIGFQLWAFYGAVWFIVREQSGWGEQFMLALGVGLLGGAAIAPAHEIGHKPGPQVMSRLSMAIIFYAHFFVQHNRGHHRHVATPDDPGSARYGETFYAFLPRAVIGGYRSSWKLEAERLRMNGKSTWHYTNENLIAWSISALIYLPAIAYAGWDIIPFIVLQAFFGFGFLEVVMYLSHYGLLREKRADGRYERIAPRHSWNSNFLISNLTLFNLQRHSDHHINSGKIYANLANEDEAPNLPAGYMLMITLALLPPLWFRAMNPRVREFYDGDLSRANLTPRLRAGLPLPAASE